MNQTEQRPTLKEEPIQQEPRKESKDNPISPQAISLERLSLLTYLHS